MEDVFSHAEKLRVESIQATSAVKGGRTKMLTLTFPPSRWSFEVDSQTHTHLHKLIRSGGGWRASGEPASSPLILLLDSIIKQRHFLSLLFTPIWFIFLLSSVTFFCTRTAEEYCGMCSKMPIKNSNQPNDPIIHPSSRLSIHPPTRPAPNGCRRVERSCRLV